MTKYFKPNIILEEYIKISGGNMGKIRSILLVTLMMVLSAFSFSYEPGSYKGEATGYGGK